MYSAAVCKLLMYSVYPSMYLAIEGDIEKQTDIIRILRLIVFTTTVGKLFFTLISALASSTFLGKLKFEVLFLLMPFFSAAFNI